MMIMLKILGAIVIGLLHGLYGSGYLKRKWNFKLLNLVLKWFIIPVAMVELIFYFSQSWLAFIYPLPYLFKMATGTGGDAQAYKKNTINNPFECWGFDQIADKLADLVYKPRTASWKYEEYCRLWGFWFCCLWAIIFTLPFIFTDYLKALPLLFYGYYHRYLERRYIEIGFTSLSIFLFLWSL